MAQTNKALDEKHAKIIKQLLQEPENKRCMDCGTKGPVYVCLNFNTFICTQCSGLHREFTHRVKSISMASFKPEEIKALQTGGNAVARKKWLARWSPEDFPEPDPSDSARVKAFMKLKYVDKRWYSETGEGAPASAHFQQQTQTPPPATNTRDRRESFGSSTKKPENYPTPEPLTNILGKDIPPIQFNNGPPSNPKPATNAHVVVAPPSSHPPPQPQGSLVDWDTPTAAKKADTSDSIKELLSIPDSAQQQYQAQLQMQQQHNLYQQQQQLVMAQFAGMPQQSWGGAPVGPGYYPPYGSQQNLFQAQPQYPQQPGFFNAPVAAPVGFFTPPTQQPAPSTASFPTGTTSPTFGQSPFGATAPSPTPPAVPSHAFPQPGQFGQSPGGIGQPGFGQPQAPGAGAAFAQPAAPAGAFGQPPAAQTQPGQPAPQPAADKFDIFASLSPLNNPNPQKPPQAARTATLSPALSSTALPTSSPSSTTPAATANPNPFGDPFGFGGQSPAVPAQSVPATTGGFGAQQQPQQQVHANNTDPFGFSQHPTTSASSFGGAAGGFGGPSQANANGGVADPFAFSHSSTAQQQQQANPFGSNPFGTQPQAPSQPSSAFSPFAAQQPNPFGQQQQPAQSDFANPFF